MKFRNDYWFLSNFYPCKIKVAGVTYNCVESAFQAYKCKNVDDRKRFVGLNGKDAKKLGKEIEMREDWNKVKDYVMYRLVMQKFSRNERLKLMLGEIVGEIVEDNEWFDSYWGVCNGKGLNKLGKILMRVRDELNLAPLKVPATDNHDDPAWREFENKYQTLYGRSYWN